MESIQNCMSAIMKNKPNTVQNKNTSGNTKVQKYAREIKNKRIGIISVILVILITLVASFVSYIKLDTPNFLASGMGVIRIITSDVECIEIQSNPRVMLAQPDYAMQSFVETMELEGYRYLAGEQMGSICVMEKNGHKEYINFSVNKHFSKWSWHE